MKAGEVVIDRMEAAEKAPGISEVTGMPNPANSDTILTTENRKPLVMNAVGDGRIELVSPATDAGIAQAMMASGLPRRIKYRPDFGWMAWDVGSGRWSSDGVALNRWLSVWSQNLRAACRCYGMPPSKRHPEYSTCSCDHAKKLENARSRGQVLEQTEVLPAFRQEDWDPDPLLLGVANGVVSLSDMTLRESQPSDYVTLSCPTVFDPTAIAPRWSKFVEEIQPDPAIRSYLQKLIGSGLSRLTKDQLFHFLLGEGSNGKGVFVRACMAVLGELAGTIPTGLFVRQADQSANRFAMSRLQDRRLLFGSEVPEGRALEEYRVKQLTGEDFLVVEEKFKPQQEIRFVGTVIMQVNEIPTISDHSHAMRRRLRVIPFPQTFSPNGEPDLDATLAAEASGILNWMLEGARDWLQDGLGYPEPIFAATETAIRASFTLHDFLSEALVREPEAFVRARDLRRCYTTQCRDRGLADRVSNRVFGQAVEAFMGSDFDKRDNHGVCYYGWRLTSTFD